MTIQDFKAQVAKGKSKKKCLRKNWATGNSTRKRETDLLGILHHKT